MSNSTLIIGAFDCNDRVHTFLVGSEYPGQPFSWDTILGDDLPRQGKRTVDGYWSIPFTVRIQGDTPADLEARLTALRAEIPGSDVAPTTNTAVIGQPNRSHTGALTVHASPRPIVPIDELYVLGQCAQVQVTLLCDPYVLGSELTLAGTNSITIPSPTGTTWPGVTWDAYPSSTQVYAYDSKFIVSDDATPHGSYMMLKDTAAVPVTPGARYGVGCFVEVTTMPTPVSTTHFVVELQWYDEAFSSISAVKVTPAEDICEVTAETWYQIDAYAPAGAAYAQVMAKWYDATGTCLTRVHGVEFGKYLMLTPAILGLLQKGQYRAPLDIGVNAWTNHIERCWIAHHPPALLTIENFVREMHAATWTNGTGTNSATTDAVGWPDGVGNTVRRVTGGTAYTDIPVSGPEPYLADGEYLVLARCKGEAANVHSIYHAGCDPVLIPTTTLQWLSLGRVFLPCSAVRGSAVSTLRLTMDGVGAGYASVNCVAFLPVSFGGLVGWDPASGYALTLNWEDGMLYADNVADLENSIRGLVVKSEHDGFLIVIAEHATLYPAAPLHLSVTSVPRWEQVPSS